MIQTESPSQLEQCQMVWISTNVEEKTIEKQSKLVIQTNSKWTNPKTMCFVVYVDRYVYPYRCIMYIYSEWERQSVLMY